MTETRSLMRGTARRVPFEPRHPRSVISSVWFPFGRALSAMLALAVVGVMDLVLPVAVLAQEPARLQIPVTDLTRGQVLAAGQSRIEATPCA